MSKRRISPYTLALLTLSSAAFAHPHTVNDGTQQVANGQLHPLFVSGISCQFNALVYGPAWYGLETAHHGPDSATAGKADGCYGMGSGGNSGFD